MFTKITAIKRGIRHKLSSFASRNLSNTPRFAPLLLRPHQPHPTPQCRSYQPPHHSSLIQSYAHSHSHSRSQLHSYAHPRSRNLTLCRRPFTTTTTPSTDASSSTPTPTPTTASIVPTFRRTSCGLNFQTNLPLQQFSVVLIANRGEIACRIIRTCREMNIRTVAIYSDADANALFVRMADEAHRVGPPPSAESYLNIPAIIDVALKTGAEAVHPGYGFLSENPYFVEQLELHGIRFVGPSAQAMRAMGNKSYAKAKMEASSVPITPGYHDITDQSFERFEFEAERIEYPVMVKAVAGGGGKGIRPVFERAGLRLAFDTCKSEGLNSFGNGDLLLEKLVLNARHIEFQIFADRFGNGVHIFERDCSAQRNNQKIYEESPAPFLSVATRDQMGSDAVNAAIAAEYCNAGTVEFLVDPRTMAFYFLEMNTRLQVEHPVSEMISDRDFVQWQLHIAYGYELPAKHQSDVGRTSNGLHAIEARIYAEDSVNLKPSTGRLQHLLFPKRSENVRIETGVRPMDDISMYYDPMICKLIVRSPSRDESLKLMGQCLAEFETANVSTNIEFLQRVREHEVFAKGEVTTAFIEQYRNELLVDTTPTPTSIVLASVANLLYANLAQNNNNHNNSANTVDLIGFRINENASTVVLYEDDTNNTSAAEDEERAQYNIRVSRGNNNNNKNTNSNAFALDLNGDAFEISNAVLNKKMYDKELMSLDADLYYYSLSADVSHHSNDHSADANALITKYDCNVCFFDNRMTIFCDGIRNDFITANEIKLNFIPEWNPSLEGIVCEPITTDNSPIFAMKSRMECNVQQILFKENDRVSKGDVIVIVEAMKMAHSIVSPFDGYIEHVLVSEKDHLSKGVAMVKIVKD